MLKWKKDLKQIRIIHLLLASTLLDGCTTPGQSIGFGGLVGASAGAIAGGLADPGKDGEYRTRNVLLGSALGGMAGMTAGTFLHESKEKQKNEAYQKGRASGLKASSGNMPKLKEPKVQARWVESRVVGSRYVEGHFEYQIVEPAHWEEGL
jgi:hypothetical protein